MPFLKHACRGSLTLIILKQARMQRLLHIQNNQSELCSETSASSQIIYVWIYSLVSVLTVITTLSARVCM